MTDNKPFFEVNITEAKKEKPKSRPQRWADACREARAALGAIESRVEDYSNALEVLRGLQEEYSEWRDNMPEGLQSSPLGEKLENVCEFDLDAEISLDEASTLVDECEAMDLPLGFGKD